MSPEYREIMAELRVMRQRTTVLLCAVCFMLAWLVGLTFGRDSELALTDRQQFPQSDWPYIYYLGMETVAPEQR